MTVNKEAIQLWVEALESGEYEQCQSELKSRSGGYCCLGVATDVFMKHNPGVVTEVYNEDLDAVYFAWNHPYSSYTDQLRESAFLPDPVTKWLGFDDFRPIAHNVSIPRSLVGEPLENDIFPEIPLHTLNDSEGFTFQEIADVLKKEHLSDAA